MAGVLPQWAALGLILIGIGAIQKKSSYGARVLGQKDLWLALRSDAGVNEPSDSVHQG